MQLEKRPKAEKQRTAIILSSDWIKLDLVKCELKTSTLIKIDKSTEEVKIKK